MKEQAWFEMADIRRRRVASSVWIPLRRMEHLKKQGNYSSVGSLDEFDGVGSIAVLPEHRQFVEERLGWSDIGIGRDPSPYASKKYPYKPADVVWHNDGQQIGVAFVFVQRLNYLHANEWIVNPDLVMALGLLKEGESWVCASEGYVEVMRQRRNADGDVIAIEIKSEFLRDYLCARGLALRVTQYHQRMEIVEAVDHLAWAKDGLKGEEPSDRFVANAWPIGADGGPPDASLAVFKVWRTDVDHEQDAQVFEKENDENTGYESSSFVCRGQVGYRVEGELWREEWIEPALTSPRVRGDDPEIDLQYLVDAGGTRMRASALDGEDVGRWLCFRPQVIAALLNFRGSALGWYTENTGSVRCSPDDEAHFGIDESGLINVYAPDVARLPLWQQQVWYGFNTVPTGPTCRELVGAQMATDPADTKAPEDRLRESLKQLDDAMSKAHGKKLFRDHPDMADMLNRMHRFRGLDDRAGVLSLAKDIARATADAIDGALLRTLVPADTKSNLGSLKLLETYLAQKTNAAQARKIVGPLVGVYGLRLADAHPASSSIADDFALANVDIDVEPVTQAKQLLASAANALQAVLAVIA